ncbi:hypothetical protein ACQ4PT_031963 [Festuca glaucescens]
MEADRPAPAAAAATAASVLGNDDLLCEILLRLGSSYSLLRAAVVSKGWLLQASNSAFLRRFRNRHTPRLLGFYVSQYSSYEFVPLLQPPELAVLLRRAASFDRDNAFFLRCTQIYHCRNGRLISGIFEGGVFKNSLVAPLLAEESMVVLPPAPLPSLYGDPMFSEIFLPEDGGRDGITLVHLCKVARKVYAEVYVLGSGGWSVAATTETDLAPQYATTYLIDMLPPVRGKVFMVTTLEYTLGLDLAAPSLFTLELPAGMRYNYILSSAKDSGLHLVYADGFQLSVWLHQMIGDNNGWMLVDTFCIREACARVAGESWVSGNDDFIWVAAVGDNAEFVFLDHVAGGIVFYVHLKKRVVEKVYQRAGDDRASRVGIDPIMMAWPPIFPARNVGHDQEE